MSSLAAPEPETRSHRLWRSAAAGPAVALTALIAAVVATRVADVPLRDPGGVSSMRLAVASGLVALLIAVDVAVGARRRSGRGWPSPAALAQVRRERWPAVRLAVVAAALVSFFATYFAYRNIKSVAPLLRPEALYDEQLLDLDRLLFAGEDPAALLHGVLGTGAAAHTLSAVYMAFFVFIPITLAVALVWSRRAGLFLVTALSANWLLAAGSYLVLPSIGPFHADAATYAALPATAVSDLQTLLLAKREAFLLDPATAGGAQSIGAFASLHTSIVCTAAIAAHLLGLPRPVKAGLWALFGLTVVATVYFGWHYLLDDAAGVLIALVALVAARALTGVDLERARGARRATPSIAEAA